VKIKHSCEWADMRAGPISSGIWRRPAILVVLVSAQFVTAPNVRAQEALTEYQVKAAYLFNFLKFVEYPSESFTDSLAPIVIGVVGDDPFGDALPQVVLGKTVQGRDLVIRVYRSGEDLRGAHILFISASERKKMPMILSGLRGSSVLTVSDAAGFLDAGGMIQFLNENDRVRFAINVDATSRAKLKMSSKLLSLAKVVGGNGKEPGN
jgi:YfiR/HmsC-like